MEKYNIIQVLLFLGALITCYMGVYQDIKERKFKNKLIAVMIVLGFTQTVFANRIADGLILFLVINGVGIFLSEKNILAPSDWKVAAAMTLFIPLEKPLYSVIFIIVLILCAILMKMYYTKPGHLKEAFMDEWKSLQCFVLTRQWLPYRESDGIYKEGTTPATVNLAVAFTTCALMYICALLV